ncbi:MAG: lipid A biosynthesis lauroyl acyltransferase [Xanthobacteraceae bacterium]|nr:lipid A biosynthesis lauroyl acyltransferase [Xanthobacteraceae bacterium]MBX3550000.1 lipid A biosynthesis lauroyl acyltransferase [Xanthobacteraceae bacterium]
MGLPFKVKFYYWIKTNPVGIAFWRAMQGPIAVYSRIRDFFVWLIVRALVAILRALGTDRSSNLAGRAARWLGPKLSNSKIARANLKASFPEKSGEEIEEIVRGVWENLGRVAGEFVHLPKMWDFDPDKPNTGRIEFTPRTAELYNLLRDDGKPAIFVSAHLANWELPAVAAFAHGLDTSVVYKAPTNRGFAELVRETRTGAMADLISSDRHSVFAMTKVLEEGRHLGLVVDQHFGGGVPVTMFGRKAFASPLPARLARNVDCPVHAVRAVRLPGNRFRMELTEELQLPRDAEGKVDINAATQKISDVFEGWIRETPEQWLWLHRRWR